jgi:glycosyltransferase involved in cell wall biosynthesis
MRTPTTSRPLKILHVITGLSRGGAETMLYKLIAEHNRNGDFTHSVIALGGENVFDFDNLGVPVTLARLASPLRAPGAIYRLRQQAKELQPDIVHGWMYHANAVACLIAPKETPVLAGIRCTLCASQEKALTRASIWLGPSLIRARRGRVIYCSERSQHQHEAVGYPPEGALIIPNGFDCERFKPDGDAYGRLCAELGLAAGVRFIGHAARYHPMKNHESLIRAFAKLGPEHRDVHLVLAGRDITPGNGHLSSMIDALFLSGRVHMLGERADIDRLFPAFEVYVSSSAWGEAFPNVLGEAMASGVPCIATDVGDSEMIVGDAGKIVPPADDQALALAMEHFVSLSLDERRRLGQRARARICRDFGLTGTAAIYAHLYASLAQPFAQQDNCFT